MKTKFYISSFKKPKRIIIECYSKGQAQETYLNLDKHLRLDDIDFCLEENEFLSEHGIDMAEKFKNIKEL
jgi:hypothetical protein